MLMVHGSHSGTIIQQKNNQLSFWKICLIIVHCKQDRLTPHEGALAAYQKLIDTGHKNSYLISVDVDLKKLDSDNFDAGHIDVLDTEHLKQLRTILLDYQLLPAAFLPEQGVTQLTQHTSKDYTETLDALENKEKWVKRFGSCLYATLYTSIGVYILHKLGILEKVVSQLHRA